MSSAKRCCDFCAALLGLVLLSPLLLLLTVLVRRFLGSPALFRQKRPGMNGRPFMMYKFRSMTDERDAAGELLPDQRRLTAFGKFLRGTSLDELPELFNVLSGEMSLVGPRPLLMEYLPLYSEQQARRHEVRPGITGWAQVNGRNAIGWEDRFRLDLWYVEKRSFWLDLKILCMTLRKVFRREGISQQGEATMSKFTGTGSSMDAREKIFVFGASGHAKVVIDIIERQGRYEIAFLADDDARLKGREVYGYRVIGGKSELLASGLRTGIVAIGSNRARAAVADWLSTQGCELISAVHPSAQLARGSRVGPGSVIMAGVLLNSDASIGNNVIVNTRASIDHDCCIGDGAHIAPGVTLCGAVSVGAGSFICAGATVIPNLSIGSNAVVGAGATVLRDVPDGVTAVGSPARLVPRD